jgi:ferredoxin
MGMQSGHARSFRQAREEQLDGGEIAAEEGLKEGEKMAKGEIVINEAICKGCGYCGKFCSRGCIEMLWETGSLGLSEALR